MPPTPPRANSATRAQPSTSPSARVYPSPSEGAGRLEGVARRRGQPYRYLAEQIGRRELTLVLGGLMMSLFLGSLNQSIVNTAIPRIVAELNGFSAYAWIITAYMVTSTSVVPIAGKLGDVYGRKPFLLGGAAYFVVTTVLCGSRRT